MRGIGQAKPLLVVLIFLFFTTLVFGAVNLIAPENNSFTNGTNDTIIFKFNSTNITIVTVGLPFNCTVILSGREYGTNTSTPTNTTVEFKLNQSITNTSFDYTVRCDFPGGSQLNDTLKRNITIDNLRPTWNETPTNTTFEFANATFSTDVNASDQSPLGIYYIDDTVNFTIDSTTGRLRNNTNLAFGPYFINISINDSLGFVLTNRINITVVDTTAPFWLEIPQNTTFEFGNVTLVLDLNASDARAIDGYFISDTANFTINSTGHIRNNTNLLFGPYFINITVNDTITNNRLTARINITVVDTTAPFWLEIPQNTTRELGSSFLLDLNASDLRAIDGYFISDTTNFTINSSGAITNNTNLVVGTYFVNITVNDTIVGNTITNRINITVVDTTPPTWNETPPNVTLEAGSSFFLDVNASDIGGIDVYSINDTGNFKINSANGIIQNNTGLALQTFFLNVSVNDTTGNLLSTIINVTVQDTGPPTITSISAGSISTTGATITWTTSESANSTVNYGINVSLGTIVRNSSLVTSHSIVLSSLSETTVYHYNVTSCDVSGNCNTSGPNNFTTSTTAAATTTTTTSTGGGASGSFSLGGAYKTADSVSVTSSLTKVWESLTAYEASDFTITKEDIPITTISLELSKDVKAPTLRIGALSSKPTNTMDLEVMVYKYLEITKTQFENEDISSSSAKFRVPRSWLNDNRVDKNEVALYRFNDDQWNKLITSIVEEEVDFVVYTSAIPGFSFFAIAGAVPPAVPVVEEVVTAPEPESVPEPTPEPEQFDVMALVWIFGVIIIGIVLYLVFIKKKSARHMHKEMRH